MTKRTNNTTPSTNNNKSVTPTQLVQSATLYPVADTDTYRQHGKMAQQQWQTADRASGIGDGLFALAIAEYIQTHDKYLSIIHNRKGNETAREIVVLSDLDAYRSSHSDKRSYVSAAYDALFTLITGQPKGNAEQSSVNKTRLWRSYPAALQLVARSKQLGVKLSDVISVNRDGRITIADYVIDQDKPKPVTPEAVATTVQVPMSVASLKSQYVVQAAKTTTTRAPHGHDQHATATPNADTLIEQARAASAKQFADACTIIMQRLNDLSHNQPTAKSLAPAEVDKLARLAKALSVYEQAKAKRNAAIIDKQPKLAVAE